MCRALFFVALFVTLFPAPSHPQKTQRIESRAITAAELPRQLDTSRVFEFRSPTVDADSILDEMLRAGVPMSRAWLPLDNRCTDLVGPRFTVELTSAKARLAGSVQKFGFVHGNGRLHCAVHLMLFTLTR